MADPSHDSHESAAFAAGKAQTQMEFVLQELREIKSDVTSMRVTQEQMGRQLASLEPLSKIFWAVVTAAVGAVGASIYAVITATHR